MFDLHGMSTPTLILLHRYYAITDTDYWRTHWCCIIYTSMRSNHLIDRVFTCISKFRRNTFVVERSFQEGLAQTIAICIKIVVYIAIFKPKSLLPSTMQAAW